MADTSMVPVGQEYGKRQETEGLMRQAGIPQGVLGAGRPPVPAAAGQSGPGGPAAPLDLLMARKPVHPMDWQPPDPLVRLRNLAQTSPNPYVRAVLRRMLENR